MDEKSLHQRVEENHQRRLSDLEQTTAYFREQLAVWKRKAKYDDLTGLLRRETFDDFFDKLISRSYKLSQPLSLILIDIDFFKRINDTYGHAAGDEMLRLISKIITDNVRETDLITRKVVGRYGGEELVVALPNTDVKGALVVGERVRKAVEELHVAPLDLHVTISAGIATYTPRQGYDKGLVAVLYETADQKLKAAKEKGKNTIIGGENL